MHLVDALSLTCWALLAVFWIRMAYRAIMKKLSPRHALKYEQVRQRKVETMLARDRAKRARRELRKHKQRERLTAWAEAHPDNPVAKAHLQQEVPRLERRDKANALNPSEELRIKQAEHDEYAQRIKDRRAADELRSQQLLNWAIGHPNTPEARRHIEEQLEATTTQLQRAESSVEHYRFMLRFHRDENDPNAILYGSQLVEAEAQQREQQALIRRLTEALNTPASES